jgi:nucleoid DNA-binding protein
VEVNLDKHIRELAKKYGKDERVIRSIVNSPFLFAKRTMMSLEDERPISIPGFGSFVVRWKKGKYLSKVMILNKSIKKLVASYMSKNISPDLKEGIKYSVEVLLDIIKKEGYENEQSVQHLIEWKSRVEGGEPIYSPVRSNMGEGQIEDEGTSS